MLSPPHSGVSHISTHFRPPSLCSFELVKIAHVLMMWARESINPAADDVGEREHIPAAADPYQHGVGARLDARGTGWGRFIWLSLSRTSSYTRFIRDPPSFFS